MLIKYKEETTEDYLIRYGKRRYCSCVQSEGTKGRQVDKEGKEGFLPSWARGGWVTTFGNGHSPPASWDEFPLLSITVRTHFAGLYIPISAHLCLQLTPDLIMSCMVCTMLPSSGRHHPSLYVCPVPVLVLHGAHVSETPLSPGGSLAKSRGDRGSWGAAAGSVLTLSRARVHPASPIGTVGGTHPCIPLGGTDEKGMLLVSLICL